MKGWYGSRNRLFNREDGVSSSPAAPEELSSTINDISRGMVGVVFTLYRRGHPVSGVSAGTDLEETTGTAVRRALLKRDSGIHWPTLATKSPDSFVIAVLYESQHLGLVTASTAAHIIRGGRDSFSVLDGQRSGLFLDAVLCQRSWSKEAAATELVQQAGISAERAWWTTYKTASYACRSNHVFPVEFGARRRNPGDAVTRGDIQLMAEHIHRRLDVNGWPARSVVASTGAFERNGRAAWCIQALLSLWAAALRLGRTDWRSDAELGLTYAVRHLACGERATLKLPAHGSDPNADASLLCFLAEYIDTIRGLVHGAMGRELVSAAIDGLADEILSWVEQDGSLIPRGIKRSRSDQDTLPGRALLALATYSKATGRSFALDWQRVLSWYRTRFELLHPWDLAAWHSRVWPTVSRLTGDTRYGEFSLELADWMCRNQLEIDGSFLSEVSDDNDGPPAGPSSRVALIAEGIVSAWRWAIEIGDEARCQRYERAWLGAMAFLDRLLVRSCDTYWMPEPSLAVGAIRTSQSTYELRADSSSHALAALMAGLDAQQAALLVS